LNILDFKAEELKGPVLDKVFQVVERLFIDRYKDFQPSVKDLDIPIDIDTFEGQVAMKDYLEIRVVEELMEMREALNDAVYNNGMDEHIYEEIGDSFNFLINSYILYGWNSDKFKSVERLWQDFKSSGMPPNGDIYKTPTLDAAILEVVYDIGLTCNKLKIRPWKKSQYLTDMLVFEERLEKVYYSFMNLVFHLNIHPEMLWSIFSRKNQCNEFRLDTGY
jgi:hypothetical protein